MSRTLVGLLVGAVALILLLPGIFPEPFWRAWAATGATSDQYYYNSWSADGRSFQSIGSLEGKVKGVCVSLALRGKMIPKVLIGPLFRQVEILGVGTGGAMVTVKAQSINLAPGLGEKAADYLVVNAKARSLSSLEEVGRRIWEVYGRLGKTPWVNTAATGTLKGNLRADQRDALEAKIMLILAASPVEESVGNISARSPILAPSVTYAGKKINLQVRITYDAAHRQTRVWVGSPVIPLAY